MTDDELGRVAYYAWIDAVFRRRHGRSSWTCLPDLVRRGWITVGKAVADEVGKR